MKKLTILLLLFTVFTFAEWDVDPDASTFTADSINAEKAVIEKLTTDSTIINDYLLMGDTVALADGGFVVRPANNRVELWNDTLWFKGFHPSLEYMISSDTGKIYGNENASLALSHSKAIDIYVPHGTLVYKFASTGMYSTIDTIFICGTATYRWKAVDALRLRVSSPDKSDVGTVYYDANDTLHIVAESGDIVKINNDLNVNGEVTSNSVTSFNYVDLDIDDTEEYELTVADGKAGWGMASLEAEWTYFRFTADGVVTLVNNTTNVTTTDGTDNNFNIFDSGTTITFENQLGDNKELNINVWFTL